MLEPVPWVVDGAEHSAEVGRVLAYIACGGTEGVVTTNDFKVRASDIPDGNIHIQPGALACLNRFPGGGQQAYIVRNTSDTVVAMSPQGSSGERWDLVCLVVEDPEYPGQPDPVSIADGPYVRINVYEDVDAATRSLAEVDPDQSGYALALVHFNASDGTVSAVDIGDLRDLLNPKTSIATTGFVVYPNASPAIDNLALNDPVPAAGVVSITVPSWCNRISFSIAITGLILGDFDTAGVTPSGTGALTAVLGALSSTPLALDAATATINTVSAFGAGFGIVAGAELALWGGLDANGFGGISFTWNVDIPEAMRNTVQDFHVKLSTRAPAGGQDFAVFPGAQMTMNASLLQSMDSVY